MWRLKGGVSDSIDMPELQIEDLLSSSLHWYLFDFSLPPDSFLFANDDQKLNNRSVWKINGQTV